MTGAAQRQEGAWDRTIHAACGEWQVVRYDRAGKWYVEYEPPRRRSRAHIEVNEAARLAVQMQRESAGHIYLGRSGGGAFDRKVKVLLAEEAPR